MYLLLESVKLTIQFVDVRTCMHHSGITTQELLLCVTTCLERQEMEVFFRTANFVKLIALSGKAASAVQELASCFHLCFGECSSMSFC